MSPFKPILAGLALLGCVAIAHAQDAAPTTQAQDRQPAPEAGASGAATPQGRPRRRPARFDAENEVDTGAAATSAPVADQACEQALAEALEQLLDCDERRQAAEATERAIAGPPGTPAAWQSARRPNASGSSTVIAVEPAGGDGRRCVVVTDVVAIDGTETRVPSRMCRVPPSARYVRR